MTPTPRHALVFGLGGVQFVLRPAVGLFFLGIALALDLAFLPLALPGQPAAAYHAFAAAMTAVIVAATLAHEMGHALACRLQGVWPVRITLRGSGAACAALVYRDSAPRALARALSGPAATVLVAGALAAVARVPALPASWRVVAGILAAFMLSDFAFNILPVHPRSDGTHTLRAVLWLLRGEEPDTAAVLHLWRPTILAAAVLILSRVADDMGYEPFGTDTMTLGAYCALALCAIPPVVLLRRYLAAGGRQAAGA